MTARVQENRTATPNQPPANNTLAVGELYIEMADPLRLWTGVPVAVAASGVRLILDANAQAAVNAGAVQKAGDTMTGPLVLSGTPTAPAQAANKAYVDQTAPGLAPVQSVATRTGNVVLAHTDITDWTATLAAALTPYAPLASPALTGAPTAPTPAVGSVDTKIATTQFVRQTIDTGPPAGAIIAPGTPVAPPGTLWWDSTGGQLYLRYDDGNSQQWVATSNMEGLANAATKQDVAATQNNVGRNLLHNSMFNVAQRGTGPWTTSGAYTLDRWQIFVSGDTLTVLPFAFTDAERAAIGDEAAQQYLSAQFTGNAAAGALSIADQHIEGVRRLSGKTVTISFYANAGAALKLGVSLDQNFGTGGSPSAGVSGVGQAITLSTTWARYSLTFSLAPAAGKTLGTNKDDNTTLYFWYSSGSTNANRAGNIGVQSGVINLWGVQLEIGSTATPLEKPDPQQDLAKCQRFYQLGEIAFAGYGTAGLGTFAQWTPQAGMRAAPTLTLLNNYCSNGSFTGFSWSVSTAIAGVTVGAAGPFTNHVVFSASADL